MHFERKGVNASEQTFACKGEKDIEYYIMVGKQKVSVSREVYKECCRFGRKERYFRESDFHNGVFSYDALDTEETSGEEMWMDTHASVAEQVEGKMMREALYKALEKLQEEDRNLILRIYFYEKSLRQIAKELNTPVTTLQYRHQKALLKLKKEIKFIK